MGVNDVLHMQKTKPSINLWQQGYAPKPIPWVCSSESWAGPVQLLEILCMSMMDGDIAIWPRLVMLIIATLSMVTAIPHLYEGHKVFRNQVIPLLIQSKQSDKFGHIIVASGHYSGNTKLTGSCGLSANKSPTPRYAWGPLVDRASYIYSITFSTWEQT